MKNSEIDIIKVVYKLDDQIEIINNELRFALECCKDMSSDFANKEDAIVHTVSSTSANYIRFSILKFKDIAFKEEREWRAIYINNIISEEGYQAPSFRVANNDIIPYLLLDLSPSAQKKHGIYQLKE